MSSVRRRSSADRRRSSGNDRRRSSGNNRRKSSGATRLSLMEGGGAGRSRTRDHSRARSSTCLTVLTVIALFLICTASVCVVSFLTSGKRVGAQRRQRQQQQQRHEQQRQQQWAREGGTATAREEDPGPVTESSFDPPSHDVLVKCAPLDSPNDCDALVALAQGTGVATWKKSTGWLSGSSVCTWYGVDCQAGRVVEIDLGSNHLVGTISSALRKAQKLVTLNLDNNKLVGLLPPNALRLPQLRRLNLGYNKLIGGLPPDLGRTAPRLTHFFVNFNQLEGPTPWLGELTHLHSAYLCGNRLDGTVPDLHALHDLEYIDLNNNRYSGDHPSFAGLTRIKYIDFSNNQLHGTIPDLHGHPRLEFLLLNNNKLTGTLPSLGACPSLHSCDLSHNKLTGELPVFNLPKLDYIDLSYNALRGSVRLLPVPFGSTHLNFIGLANNEFAGSFWSIAKAGVSEDNEQNLQVAEATIASASLRGLDISHNAFTSVRLDICEALPTLFQAGNSRHARNTRLGCHMRGSGLDADASMCAKLPQCVKDFCGSKCDDL